MVDKTKITVNIQAAKKIPGGVRVGGGITVRLAKQQEDKKKKRWYNPLDWLRRS